MHKLHQICWIAGIEYRKWLTKKHLLVLFFSILFLGEYVFSDMLRVAQITGLRINCLEPMALILSFAFYIMAVPLIVIVELSDFPDKSSGNIFVVMRISRITWLFGELLFGIQVGATCLLVFFAASFAWTCGQADISNTWSPFMTDIYEKYPELFAQNDRLFLESGTLSNGSPVSVTLTCIGLLLFYMMLLVQILCLFRFLGRQKTGVILTIGITVFGAVSATYVETIKWFFPITHAIFGIHFDKFFAQPIVPLSDSILYFTILNAALLVLNIWMAKRCMVADEPW